MKWRRERPDLPVETGERLLAWGETTEAGAVGGTRDAFYVGATRLPWEQVEAAEWDEETSVLRVSEVGTWGEVRRVHTIEMQAPGRLLELVRERVTASVVLQRHVAVHGKAGVRVIARRPPGRPEAPTWVFEFDAGIDPSDPLVEQAAADVLRAAEEDVGLR